MKNMNPIEKCETTFEQEIYNSLVFGLKEYCSKLGFKKVLIGLSGGMDSALVTCIAVEALRSRKCSCNFNAFKIFK